MFILPGSCLTVVMFTRANELLPKQAVTDKYYIVEIICLVIINDMVFMLYCSD